MADAGQASTLQPIVPFIVGTVTSYVTLIVGAVINRQLSLRAAREARALSLHREFTSGTLSKARSQAYNLLQQHRDLSLKDLGALHSADESVNALLDIIYFYSHLSLAIRYNQIKRSLVPELFGKVFFWWYLSFFDGENGLATSGFEVADDLLWLKGWLDKNATPGQLRDWTSNVAAEGAA